MPLIQNIVNKEDQERLFQVDSLFQDIHNKYGVPPNWTRPEGFITLCQIILEQQVSLESARAHFEKLKSTTSEITPENIIQLRQDDMRKAQISRQKASYLKNLSEAILNEDLILNQLSDMEESQIREKLTSIKGIGNWTTDVYLMFCLKAKDIIPLGDVAIVNTIKELKMIEDQDDMIQLTRTWKPLRSLASFYLWHYYLCKRGRNAEF